MDISRRFQTYRILLWIAVVPCLCCGIIAFVLASDVGTTRGWLNSIVEPYLIPLGAVIVTCVVTAEMLIALLKMETNLSGLKQERRDTAELLRGNVPASLLAAVNTNARVAMEPTHSIVLQPPSPVYSSGPAPKTTARVRIEDLPICSRPDESDGLSRTGLSLRQDEIIPAFGRDESGAWVSISGDGKQWVAVQGIRLIDDVLSLPVVVPPPRA